LKKSTTSSSFNSDNCDYANEIKDKEYSIFEWKTKNERLNKISNFLVFVYDD
jgi:hypothetical protein